MITDDKKSILERVNFICAFFIWSDPKLGGDLDVKLQLVAFPIADFDWLRFSSSGLRIPPNVTYWQVDNNPYAHQPSYTQPSFYTHIAIHLDFVAEAQAQAIKQKIPIKR